MGEQYVGIDLHRRRSVIVRMTGAGEVLESIRDHNDTFSVKGSHSDKAAASRSRSPTTASSSATPRTAPARCSCSPLLSGMHSSTESATVSSTPPAPGAALTAWSPPLRSSPRAAAP
jgi:hypothetical protein